jgi:hypothetical protein
MLDARAAALCRSVAPAPFFNAQAASVGEVRGLTYGPRVTPLVKAFPKAAPTAFAAWCWARKDLDSYIAYVAGPEGTRVVVGEANGIAPPSPGSPAGQFP